MSTKYACRLPVDLLHVGKTDTIAEVRSNWRIPKSQRQMFPLG
jgi:hypothetical protein